MRELRDYQKDGISQILKSWHTGNRSIVYRLPTGGGKSVILSNIIRKAINQKRNVLALVHKIELVDQLAEHLRLEGLSPGIIQGSRKKVFSPVQVASVPTLVRRKEIPPADLIIIDECQHTTKDNSYGKIFDRYPKALKLGVTATPTRLDGKGLGDCFDDLILGPSVSDLMGEGFLVPFDLYACVSPLSGGIKADKRGGDYVQSQIMEQIDTNVLNGSLVAEYKAKANGKKLVVFCSGKEHSIEVARRYNEAGIPAASLTDDTPAKERKRIMEKFRSSEYLILTNYNIVTEGVDIPDIDGVQFARRTCSLVFWHQALGRALRPYPGKLRAIILDHTDNWCNEALPLPTRPIEWTLEGSRPPRKAEPIFKNEETGLIHVDTMISIKEIEEDDTLNLQLVNQDQLTVSYGITDTKQQIETFDRHFFQSVLKGFKPAAAYYKLLKECKSGITEETLIHIAGKLDYKEGWIKVQLAKQSAG